MASDLFVERKAHIYAIGDTALTLGDDGKILPALAQETKQVGIFLGRALKANLLRSEPVPAFHFHNRGNTAVISRNAAVFEFGTLQLKAGPPGCSGPLPAICS